MGKRFEFVSEPNVKTWKRRDNYERRIAVSGIYGSGLTITIHSGDFENDHALLEELARKGFRIVLDQNP
jgi:hypothetical protein